MTGPSLRWLVQTAAGISMAGPMFVVGIDFLRTGQYAAGLGFLALGAVVLYFPTYLLERIGGPRTWLRRRLGADDGDDAASGEPSLLERLRR